MNSSHSPALSPEDLQVLMSAVDLARTEQIKTLTRLRERLADLYPSHFCLVNEALRFWASNATPNRVRSLHEGHCRTRRG